MVSEAKRRLLDTLGCAAGAIDSPAPRIAHGVAAKARCDRPATLIGGGVSTPDWAAFANGVHIRYLDCNDTYLSLEPAHPSDNWAAIWAAGEAAGATGKDWITAAAVAYEIQCRLCDAASIRARGWDHTTYGSISATLAAARLLGLTQARPCTPWASPARPAPPCGSPAPASFRCGRAARFAFASRNALFACQLAAAGMTGPASAFRRRDGLHAAGCRAARLEPGLAGPAASDWMLTNTSIKFVPAEYHSQSAIAAAFELRDEVGDLRRIRSIEIATFRTAIEIIAKDPEKWQPRSRETADHSLPYCTAVALLDGQVSAAQFTPRALAAIRLFWTSWPAPKSSKTLRSRPAIPRPFPTA